MNISTEKLLLSPKKQRESCIFGISAFYEHSEERSFAVGKLYDCCNILKAQIETPTILLLSHPSQLIHYTEHIAKLKRSSLVGIVICARSFSEKEIAVLMSLSLPFLITESCESIPLLGAGQIAILDAKRGALTVDPNIETLKRYSLLSQKNGRDVYLRLQSSNGLRLSRSLSAESLLLTVQSPHTADELFTVLQTLSESRFERQLTVALSVVHGASLEESFCDDVEAVFLAALYGSISIIFKDFYNSSDINHALSLLKCSFCRLEENRREFNGTLKKGLLISAPLWLTHDLPMSHPDILYLELDTLTRMAFGCDFSTTEQLKMLEPTLLAFVKKHRGIPISVSFSENADIYFKKSAHALCESIDIKDVYF